MRIPKNKLKKSLTVRVDVDIVTRLKACAKAEHWKLTQIVEIALSNYLDEYEYSYSSCINDCINCDHCEEKKGK